MAFDNSRQGTHPIAILESDDNDQLLLMKAFQATKINNPLLFFRTGQEILDYYLTDKVSFKVPCLFIIDMNLTDMQGQKILQRFKGDERLCHVPLVVLTNSDNPSTIQELYLDGANSLIRKTSDLNETIDVFVQYWLKTTLLPYECIL